MKKYINNSILIEYFGIIIFNLAYKTNLNMFSLSIHTIDNFFKNQNIDLFYINYNEK